MLDSFNEVVCKHVSVHSVLESRKDKFDFHPEIVLEATTSELPRL